MSVPQLPTTPATADDAPLFSPSEAAALANAGLLVEHRPGLHLLQRRAFNSPGAQDLDRFILLPATIFSAETLSICGFRPSRAAAMFSVADGRPRPTIETVALRQIRAAALAKGPEHAPGTCDGAGEPWPETFDAAGMSFDALRSLLPPMREDVPGFPVTSRCPYHWIIQHVMGRCKRLRAMPDLVRQCHPWITGATRVPDPRLAAQEGDPPTIAAPETVGAKEPSNSTGPRASTVTGGAPETREETKSSTWASADRNTDRPTIEPAGIPSPPRSPTLHPTPLVASRNARPAMARPCRHRRRRVRSQPPQPPAPPPSPESSVGPSGRRTDGVIEGLLEAAVTRRLLSGARKPVEGSVDPIEHKVMPAPADTEPVEAKVESVQSRTELAIAQGADDEESGGSDEMSDVDLSADRDGEDDEDDDPIRGWEVVDSEEGDVNDEESSDEFELV